MANIPNAVEVDGIRFRTLVQQVVTVPLRGDSTRESIKLAGIRISNNTLKSLHFSLYNSLLPDIIDSQENLLSKSYCHSDF